VIIFSHERSNIFDLFQMNADGSDAHALTRTPAVEVAPAISPDAN